MNKIFNPITLFVVLFGIAFGLVESAVVIYIRETYYPEGFAFPLKAISRTTIYTELWREAATILMLVAIGYLAGKTRPQRFAYFLLSFAVWDIFYYIFLKLFVAWPESFFTWDILFLLPVVWIGPVLAPILLSLLMTSLAFLLLHQNQKLNMLELSLLIFGTLVSIISFVIDYLRYVSEHTSGSSTPQQLAELSTTYVPTNYSWLLFLIAAKLIIAAMIAYYLRTSKRKRLLSQMQMFV
jgi:hypothetical protein